MFIKMIGSVFVIGATSLFGYLLGREKVIRLAQLKTLKKILYQLRGEIQYGYTPLPEAMGSLGGRNETVFSEFFLSMQQQLKNYEGNTFYSIWKKEIGEKLKQTALSKSDKTKLISLGENLGYLDQEMQIKNIDLYIEGLEEEIVTESNSQKEKIRLYQLLGVLSGIFVTIVML
ncbi:MAG: stage III sporulation protein AB [Velocimicrobium sp.]